MSKVDVSIVIPTKNEGDNIPLVIPRIPQLPEIAEVLLVDAHSTDDTVKVAKTMLPSIKIVYQDGKGKGNAIHCAAKVAQGSHFMILDADGSHRPEEIPLYVDKAKQGYDLVKGSRYMAGGSTDDASFTRNTIVRTANTIANVVWRTRFTDICYGMFLVDRNKFLELGVESQSWDVEWEMMIKAKRGRLRIAEVPSREDRRVWGKSNLPNYARNGWTIARRVFGEAFKFGNRK